MTITTTGMSHQDLNSCFKKLAESTNKSYNIATTEDGTQSWSWTDGSTPPTIAEIQAVKTAALADAEWIEVRIQRSVRLKSTDWTQYSDSPLSDTDKAAYVTYRQQLRDITTQSDPFNITWPVEPTGG
jgi:hypothetical protein